MIFRKKYILETDLSLEQARKRIRNVTISGSPFFAVGLSGEKFFKGSVYDDWFYVRRLNIGGNSFEPMIHGKFWYEATGLRLKLLFKLYSFIFFIFLYVVSLFFVFPIIWFIEGKLLGEWWAVYFVLSFLVFFPIMGILLFSQGSKKAKNILMEILDAREI